MRLFVALVPPPEALAELAAAVSPLGQDWPGLRWTGQERWHVTLAFLGDVDEAKLGELATRLARAASRHSSREVFIGRGGAFPSASRARVLCAHIGGDQPALSGLSALAASVAAAARRSGAPPPDEGRRYRPHITIARTRQPADLSPLVRELIGFSGLRWPTRHIELIRSHAGPRPSYETIEHWPVGG